VDTRPLRVLTNLSPAGAHSFLYTGSLYEQITEISLSESYSALVYSSLLFYSTPTDKPRNGGGGGGWQ
jgi:hypothetical protein